jgi:hypothetical protein
LSTQRPAALDKLSVKKVSGSDPLNYVFWSNDKAATEGFGNMGRLEFASEEDLRQMLVTHGLSEAEVNAELSKVGWA